MKALADAALVDLKNDPLYRAVTKPAYVEVPEMPFILVEGTGAPKSKSGETNFQRALQVLFTIIYTIKFWDKKHVAPVNYAAFTVPPIEALWWTESGGSFDATPSDEWHWRAMLRVPEFVNDRFFKEVVREVMNQKAEKSFLEARLERIKEGPSIQMMHIGPYDQERRSIDRLLTFAERHNLAIAGKHHELYFSDPRRTAPEKLKTVIRYPVSRLK